jgi:RND superfamily putative drug exporter
MTRCKVPYRLAGKLACLPRAFVAAVTGRRSKWAVLVLAAVAVGFVGPLAGKLTALEDNSPSSFLPAGAASTRVLSYLEEHDPASSAPALVIFERAGGLGRSDRARIEAARRRIAARHLSGVTEPSPIVLATDGAAAYFAVPTRSSISQATSARDVAAIRSIVAGYAAPATANPPPGALQVAVGGPAGSAADALGAFAGIDGRLLGVTIAVVALLLLLVYRSPLLWLVPLVSVLFAASWAEGFAYLLAASGFVVNGMTVGILTVLVFGAGTDYALLLLARYREELVRHEDHHEAMAVALRRAGPAITASGLTVILALLALVLARLNDIAALGPACAAGIFCALVAQLALLPAALVCLGRRVFWPFVPRAGEKERAGGGLWVGAARAIAAHRRAVWLSTAVALALGTLGLLSYRGGVDQQNGFRGEVGSVAAQQLLAANFPAGTTAPATILVEPASEAAAAATIARATPGVAAVAPPEDRGKAVIIQATLAASPTSSAAQRTVVNLRRRLHGALGPGVLVGGETATNVDLAAAATHDRDLLLPVILAIVLAMLGLLLRSVVAPVMLTATVVLSYLASLGVSSLVARYLFGFPGFDPTVPILGFVFLVALGVDYNVFLMARVREEAEAGATLGVRRGLSVTGGVITSAGVVLAATFAVLGVLPLVALTELGFLVAFGVLVDTILVRSALVPALAIEIGPLLWWPSRLASRSKAAGAVGTGSTERALRGTAAGETAAVGDEDGAPPDRPRPC